MRLGCAVAVAAALGAVVLAGVALWVGSRLVHEPEVTAAPGSSEDAARGQQKIFDIARQPLPRFFRWLLPSPGLQGLLRWRMPDSVESITIESGTVAIKTSS